jgi:hypothetical protein
VLTSKHLLPCMHHARYAALVERANATAARLGSAPVWKDTVGLRRDAAYNLVQIYQKSNSRLARHVMQEYLAI